MSNGWSASNQRVAVLLLYVGDHHWCALGDEFLNRGAAHAAGTAGDHGNVTGEPFPHRSPLRLVSGDGRRLPCRRIVTRIADGG